MGPQDEGSASIQSHSGSICFNSRNFLSLADRDPLLGRREGKEEKERGRKTWREKEEGEEGSGESKRNGRRKGIRRTLKVPPAPQAKAIMRLWV